MLFGTLTIVGSSVGVSAVALGAANEPYAPETTTPEGSIGVRLLDVPANEANDPRARLYIVDQVAPGAVVKRRIEVSNATPSDVAISLYTAAATIDTGSFVGEPGHTANDLSSWTAVTPAAPQIPAGHTATANVTITIPGNATTGEHYAIVWAEAQTAAAPGSAVIEVNRVGVRIYLSVGTGAAPTTDFTISSLTAKRSGQGNPTVIATVHNTGVLALDMSGSLQLSAGPGGLNAGPFPAALGVTLAAGATEPVTITLNQVVPAGPWLAHVTLRSGQTQRSAQATITFPASGAAQAVNAHPTHHRSDTAALTLALPIVVGLLAISLAGVLVRRRRVAGRRRRHLAPHHRHRQARRPLAT